MNKDSIVLDLTDIPQYKKKYFWKNSINKTIKCIYENKTFSYIIQDYNIMEQKLTLVNATGDIYHIRTSKLLNKQLGNILGYCTRKFKYELKEIINNLLILERKYKTKERETHVEYEKWYKYKCLKCGYEDWKIEGNIIRRGCPVCSASPVAKLGYSTIFDKAKWMIPYVGEENAKKYTPCSNVKISTRCPECGREKRMQINAIYNSRGVACPCGDGFSYPQKFVYSLLEQLNINFIMEYSPKWCVYKYENRNCKGRYDFYFEKNNFKYILEVDGGFHKENNPLSGRTVEDILQIDKVKEDIAISRGYNVIRIKAFESNNAYMSKSCIESLNHIFNLTNIDWNRCDLFAISKLNKKVYELWNSGMTSTKRISEFLKISRSVVIKYLKNGAENGLCDYDSKKEQQKGYDLIKRPIKVYKLDSGDVFFFESISECSRRSEEIFNIKLSISSLSGHLKNGSPYKGFIIEKENQHEERF